MALSDIPEKPESDEFDKFSEFVSKRITELRIRKNVSEYQMSLPCMHYLKFATIFALHRWNFLIMPLILRKYTQKLKKNYASCHQMT